MDREQLNIEVIQKSSESTKNGSEQAIGLLRDSIQAGHKLSTIDAQFILKYYEDLYKLQFGKKK